MPGNGNGNGNAEWRGSVRERLKILSNAVEDLRKDTRRLTSTMDKRLHDLEVWKATVAVKIAAATAIGAAVISSLVAWIMQHFSAH